MSDTVYIGDDYLEAVDYLDRLKPNVIDMLKLSGIISKSSLNYELLESGIRLAQKYQETIGMMVLGKFIQNHHEYIEKLNSKKDKPEIKFDDHSMFA